MKMKTVDTFLSHDGRTVAVIVKDEQGERYHRHVSTASLRRLSRLLDGLRYRGRVEFRPWHTALGWSAYLSV